MYLRVLGGFSSERRTLVHGLVSAIQGLQAWAAVDASRFSQNAFLLQWSGPALGLDWVKLSAAAAAQELHAAALYYASLAVGTSTEYGCRRWGKEGRVVKMGQE